VEELRQRGQPPSSPASAAPGAPGGDAAQQLEQRLATAEGGLARLSCLCGGKDKDGMVPRGEMMRALEAVTTTVMGRLKKVGGLWQCLLLGCYWGRLGAWPGSLLLIAYCLLFIAYCLLLLRSPWSLWPGSLTRHAGCRSRSRPA